MALVDIVRGLINTPSRGILGEVRLPPRGRDISRSSLQGIERGRPRCYSQEGKGNADRLKARKRRRSVVPLIANNRSSRRSRAPRGENFLVPIFPPGVVEGNALLRLSGIAGPTGLEEKFHRQYRTRPQVHAHARTFARTDVPRRHRSTLPSVQFHPRTLLYPARPFISFQGATIRTPTPRRAGRPCVAPPTLSLFCFRGASTDQTCSPPRYHRHPLSLSFLFLPAARRAHFFDSTWREVALGGSRVKLSFALGRGETITAARFCFVRVVARIGGRSNFLACVIPRASLASVTPMRCALLNLSR